MKQSRLSGNGGVKEFFSKLSRGLTIPIALLPIAGLFLGIGAGFENVIAQVMGTDADPVKLQQAQFVFTVMKNIGDIVFANLPTLFCLAVALAFAEDAGVAVFSALIAWIIFNATQSTMITEHGSWGTTTGGDPIWNLEYYSVLWYPNVPVSVVTSNVGIQSLQTSVFGGITIGLFVAFLYNKFHKFEMPKVLGFFSGTRFVPIITFLTVPLLGFFFLMIWPILGMGIDSFGKSMAGAPIGLDALIFGLVERSLLPFGLHAAFYTPLWYTSAGGTLHDALDGGGVIAQDGGAVGNQGIWFAMQSLGIPFDAINVGVHGDWTSVVSSNGDFMDISNKLTGVDYSLTLGVNPGAYMQGKYPFMMFGLPAAGLAMVMASKKENRQVAMSVIGAAALTSFLTGITEPIEYTFLFIAPLMFYGFHVWMAGISFWSLDLLGSHIGMTFSGGIFDYVLYGILPDATGFHSNSYWVLLVGAIYAPIYYFVFYFWITKFDIKTPGRTEGEVSMVSKADYRSSKVSKKSNNKVNREERLSLLVENLGGIDNVAKIAACITRLRLTVNDREKINDDGLMKMGASGIVGKQKNIQIIFGAEADIFKVELMELKK